MHQVTIGQIAATQKNEVSKEFVLDASRLVIKYGSGPKLVTEGYAYFEKLMIEVETWRNYTPSWLKGWEARVKGTTQ